MGGFLVSSGGHSWSSHPSCVCAACLMSTSLNEPTIEIDMHPSHGYYPTFFTGLVGRNGDVLGRDTDNGAVWSPLLRRKVSVDGFVSACCKSRNF